MQNPDMPETPKMPVMPSKIPQKIAGDKFKIGLTSCLENSL